SLVVVSGWRRPQPPPLPAEDMICPLSVVLAEKLPPITHHGSFPAQKLCPPPAGLFFVRSASLASDGRQAPKRASVPARTVTCFVVFASDMNGRFGRRAAQTRLDADAARGWILALFPYRSPVADPPPVETRLPKAVLVVEMRPSNDGVGLPR